MPHVRGLERGPVWLEKIDQRRSSWWQWGQITWGLECCGLDSGFSSLGCEKPRVSLPGEADVI